MRKNIYINGQYHDKNPSWHEEDSVWKADKIIKIIKRNNLDIKTICDVGCGAGEVLKQVKINMTSEVECTGYEISPQAFKICITKEEDRLWFIQEDFLITDTDYFDLVLSIDVFEHIEDYFVFLRKLKDKGNYKIFHIPLDLSVLSILRGKYLINRKKNLGHLHYFTKETALEVLKDAGYNIIDHFITAGVLELPNKSIKSSLIKWPRKLLFKINKSLMARIMGGTSLLVLTQ